MAEARAFPARPGSLAEIRRFIAAHAVERGLPDWTVQDIVLAVNEASANAILHSDSSEVRVTWEADGPCVQIKVEDQGTFRPRPTGNPRGGRGLPLMMALVDEFGLVRGSSSSPGTVVRLVKC
jgi:anti-sigma regulatory factor (Ser/Thr protein kinase)